MKCKLFVTACLLAFSGALFALEKGDVAPAFELETATSSKVALQDLRNNYVYIDFWASWCGPCRQSFPWMNALQEKYKSKGLRVLAINLDMNRSDADKFLAEVPAQFQIAFDNKGLLPKLYAVKGMPSSFLIGPDGKIIFQHTGFMANKADELEAMIFQQLGAH